MLYQYVKHSFAAPSINAIKNYNYKPFPRILRQHRVLRNLRKNKDIVITKPDKGNGVLILDRKLYDNTIEERISDTFIPSINFLILVSY